MPAISLEQFAEQVPGLRKLSDPEKIKLFAWFAHRALGQDRLTVADVRACYNALHINPPNISENLSRLLDKKPRVLLKDGKGYFLEGSVRAAFDGQYLSLIQGHTVEVGDHILPDDIVVGTKPYIEKLAWQINGCYEYQFYDGCAVLMRRLTESLLIEAFVKAGHVDKIRQNNEFLMLAGIIAVAKQGKCFMLARGSDDILETIKYVGDRAAHSRTYVSVKKDVLDVIPKFRTIVAELMHLSGIHAAKPAA